jgi:hypothetical protein
MIYCVDFGMSKRYRDKTTLEHIEHYYGRSFKGTPRYSSINCLDGSELSRRDDLESLAYSLIYFMKGKLPWQGLKASKWSPKSEKYAKVLDSKIETTIEQLCEAYSIC